MCNSLLIAFTTSWRNLNKIWWSELHKIWIFLTKKPAHFFKYVNHLWYIVSAILKEVLHVKQIMMLRVFIVRLPSFIIPKIVVIWHFKWSLKLIQTWAISHVLFETVRTLKYTEVVEVPKIPDKWLKWSMEIIAYLKH